MDKGTFDTELADIKNWVGDAADGRVDLSLLKLYEDKLSRLIQDAQKIDKDGFYIKKQDYRDAASALLLKMRQLEIPKKDTMKELGQKVIEANLLREFNR